MGPLPAPPHLPCRRERVPTEGTDAWFLDDWTHRWRPSASPLLRSHAMVVSARLEIAAASRGIDRGAGTSATT